MAITFGNTATGTSSITINSNGDFLLVGLNTTANTVSAVDFNGDAMTKIGTTLDFTATGRFIEIWGLVNPDAGSHDVTITGGANISSLATSISGYSSNSGFNSGTSASSPTAVSVTTTVNNAYVVSYGIFVSFSSLGSGLSNVVAMSDPNVRMVRSTSAITPAGAFSTSINTTGSAVGGMVSVGINPVVTNTGNMLLVM